MDLLLSRFAFIFLIYVVVTSGYINEILSCQMRRFLRESRLFRHILGVVMVFVFIMLEGGWSFNADLDAQGDNNWSSGHVLHTAIMAVGIYIVFLLSSKSRLTPNLIFFTLVLVLYFINTYRNYLNARKLITPEENERILMASKGLFIVCLAVLSYGFADYIVFQQKEYGHRFEWTTFLLGSSKCKHVPNHSSDL
jgi:hypothetical protein